MNSVNITDEIKQDMEKMRIYAEKLYTDGVVVIPFLKREQVAEYNKMYMREFSVFPEYKKHSGKQLLVKGSFGALGNPSSFHNPVVRQIRQQVMGPALSLFRQVEQLNVTLNESDQVTSYRNLEQLFDRTSLRPKGTKTTRESFHRDISTGGNKDKDDIYGGWVNLDIEGEQRFSCVPRTHKDAIDETGFSVFKDQTKANIIYNPLKKFYSIPPGYLVVFNQRIVHEITGKTQTIDSLRQYIGWRLTPSTTPLFNAINAIETQGVPLIPSGQGAAMYSTSHGSFHLESTCQWSTETFNPVCIETKENQKTKELYQIVKRFMDSLSEMELPLYPRYTVKELDIMTPQPLFPEAKRKFTHAKRINEAEIEEEQTETERATKRSKSSFDGDVTAALENIHSYLHSTYVESTGLGKRKNTKSIYFQ